LAALTAVGSESLKAEELKSAEMGYKHHITSKLYAEAAVFYNEFEDIIEIDQASAEFGVETIPFNYMTIDAPMNNIVSSNIWGGEGNLEWQAYDWWKLIANYSYAKIRIKEAGSVGFTGGSGSAPRHQVKFISSTDLRENLSLDVMLYYIDDIKSMPSVSSRYDLDLRLGWRPTDYLEFALVGQNLFYHEKQQMEQFLFLGTATKRSGYLQLTWDF
jgi:iron complex outermembrane receptor protein